MEIVVQYRPQEAAQRLGIASSTLRLWSSQFANELSNSARKVASRDGEPIAQRRYTDEDLRLLAQVKELLAQGLTYEEVKRRLRPPVVERAPRERPAAAQPRHELLDRDEAAPAAAFSEEVQLSIAGLKEALAAKDKTIAALKESLGFLDVYLHALKEERDDAKEQIRQTSHLLEEQRALVRELERQLMKPWWRRLAGLP